MSNPTTGVDKADSSGRFPVIYAAEGGNFDYILKDAAGVTLASYLNVASLGSNTGTLTRDFTTSRFSARGSGGTTYIEVGDPSGDDVGGTGVIGGWLGTQADSLTVNAALVNVTGRIKENGYRLAGVARTAGASFSAAANVDIPLTNDPTGVRVFDIDIIDLLSSSTNYILNFSFSFDGGGTFPSTGSIAVLAAYTTAVEASGGSGSAFLGVSLSSPATKPGAIQMRVITPDSGTNLTTLMGTFSSWENPATSNNPKVQVFAGNSAGAGRATHIRLTPSAGTISGLYRVVPQRGFGET